MDRYAVIMYDVPTGHHELYDIYLGDGAVLLAVDMAINEMTPRLRPIVLDVNELIAESGITADELAELMEARP